MTVLAVCWLSAVGIVAGVVLGQLFLIHPTDVPGPVGPDQTVARAMCNWDGHSYVAIADRGYTFDGDRARDIAFFPAVPGVAHWVGRLSGVSTCVSLIAVANVSLAGGLLGLRWLARSAGQRAATLAVVAAAFWPPGLFARMGETEGPFLLLAVLALVGIRRRWSPWTVAASVGLATGTRSVGVALVPPLLLYAWERRPASRRQAVTTSLALLPLALWGVLAFAAYQWLAGGSPLWFVRIQNDYRMRPRLEWAARAYKLLTFEPIRAAYNPRSDGFWATLTCSADVPHVAFNMEFWNPIYFVAAVGLVVLGGVKRWLDRYELTMSVGLLLIPYVTRGYDFGMCSQARFTVVCFPIYLVLGRLLAALPEVWRTLLIVLAGLQMCAWAALFAAGYPIF